MTLLMTTRPLMTTILHNNNSNNKYKYKYCLKSSSCYFAFAFASTFTTTTTTAKTVVPSFVRACSSSIGGTTTARSRSTSSNFRSSININSRSMTSSSSLMGSTAESSTSSSSASKIAAIAQLRSTGNKLDNLLDVAKCCGMAQQSGASIVFLPECFAYIGLSVDGTLENAEPSEYITCFQRPQEQQHGQGQDQDPLNSDRVNTALINAFRNSGGILLDSKENDKFESRASSVATDTKEEEEEDIQVQSVTAALATLARISGLWISAGGLHVKGDAPSDSTTGRRRVYNTHLIFDNNGIVQARYDKRHLFDVSIPSEGVELRESKGTAPGTTKSVVCDSPIGRLGLSICYDVRFPEHYTELVRQHSAEILLVPSAFTVPTGAAHWHILLQARAIENQCYVFAAAQYGIHNEKRKSFGHAIGIDPWGTIVADAGGYPRLGQQQQPLDGSEDGDSNTSIEIPSIVTCEVDLGQVESTRQRMPLHLHRKNAEDAEASE